MVDSSGTQQVPQAAMTLKLTRKLAVALLAVLLLLLLLGTQMPGAWRDEAFRVTHLPWQMTKVAHFVLFAAMAFVARVPPLRWPVVRVGFIALALGFLTEGLQHFASNRDPSWLDVGIDLAGMGVGMLVAMKAKTDENVTA
jgi:VanZ family protein